jgi:hypothetical protein
MRLSPDPDPSTGTGIANAAGFATIAEGRRYVGQFANTVANKFVGRADSSVQARQWIVTFTKRYKDPPGYHWHSAAAHPSHLGTNRYHFWPHTPC